MKKFISWISVIGVLVFMVSCRETEDLTTLPEADHNNTTKTTNFKKDSTIFKKDSTQMKSETSSTSDPNLLIEEKDPPKKDKFEW